MLSDHERKKIETTLDAEAALAGVDFPESYLISIAINAYSIELTILADVSGYRKIEETESALRYIRFVFFGLGELSQVVDKKSFLHLDDRDKSVDLGSIHLFSLTPFIDIHAPFEKHRLKCDWAYGKLGFIYEKCEAIEMDADAFEA